MNETKQNQTSDSSLIRGVGLLQATSTNMLNMIGIGPFITIPIMIASLGGPHAMIGWVMGAVISICDGMVWAELGAAMPGSGGPYLYLQQAYGPQRLGRLMSFLYIWQTIFIAPLSIASGAVGFALYTKYFWPSMTPWHVKGMAAGLCLFVTFLLYRDIRSVGRLSVGLWVVVMLTVGWIVGSGLFFFQPRLVLDLPPDAFTFSRPFFLGLGSATLIAMYSYGGYFNVCLFGGEVKNPGATIPRSILLAIVAVAALYITMSVTILGVVPWREAMQTTSVVSDFIETLYGPWAGKLVTGLILWTALGSVFAIVLGYSRVPYAAAREGRFFKPFARVHPTKRFPSFSLVVIGLTSALACWFTLEEIIKALLVIQIIIQYMAQVAAVTLIRRFRPEINRPFKMWLYPLPVIVAFGGWMYILISSGVPFILAGIGLLLLGIRSYLWLAGRSDEWPFTGAGSEKILRIVSVLDFGTAGLFIGGVIAYLLRPTASILGQPVGQLPFKVVITRGAYLGSLEQALRPVAQTSFNFLVAGMLIGAVSGMIIGYFKSSSRKTAPQTPRQG